MIYINLLPWREELSEAEKKNFIQVHFLVGLVAVAMVGLVYGATFGLIDRQEAVNTKISHAVKIQEKRILEIKDLKEQIQILIDRKKVVESLQNNRNEATRIFVQLASLLPEGVSLKSVKQQGVKITLNGVALNNSLISHTMTSLEKSKWLFAPVLVEIKAIDVRTPGGATIKASEFTLDVKYGNPEDTLPTAAVPRKH